jgi:hypothetical protein
MNPRQAMLGDLARAVVSRLTFRPRDQLLATRPCGVLAVRAGVADRRSSSAASGNDHLDVRDIDARLDAVDAWI